MDDSKESPFAEIFILTGHLEFRIWVQVWGLNYSFLLKCRYLKKHSSVPFRYMDEIQLQQGKILQGILVLVSK